MREQKRIEYYVCIMRYYNTKSFRNASFEWEDALLFEPWKSLKTTQIPFS